MTEPDQNDSRGIADDEVNLSGGKTPSDPLMFAVFMAFGESVLLLYALLGWSTFDATIAAFVSKYHYLVLALTWIAASLVICACLQIFIPTIRAILRSLIYIRGILVIAMLYIISTSLESPTGVVKNINLVCHGYGMHIMIQAMLASRLGNNQKYYNAARWFVMGLYGYIIGAAVWHHLH